MTEAVEAETGQQRVPEATGAVEGQTMQELDGLIGESEELEVT